MRSNNTHNGSQSGGKREPATGLMRDHHFQLHWLGRVMMRVCHRLVMIKHEQPNS